MKNQLFKLCVVALFLSTSAFGQNYSVAKKSITFKDPDRRNRSIATEIYYPDGGGGKIHPDGNFPVIVFGHGFLMRWDAYSNIWNSLVPEGYILAFPRTEGNFSPNHEAFGQDLAFLVEEIIAQAGQSGSFFYGGASDEVAIAGHSMGGGAGVLAAAQSNLVKTYIGLAPAETRTSAIAAASNVSADALILVGESDGVTPYDENALPIYENLGSSCKTIVKINGGAHCYFAQSNFYCDFGERFSAGSITVSRTEQQQIAQSYMKLWLDYKLKGDNQALAAFNNQLANANDVTYAQNCRSQVVSNEIISVFPNPSENIFYFDGLRNKNATVEVVDAYGKITSVPLRNAGYKPYIDLSEMKKGIYKVRVVKEGKATQFTLIKE